MRNWPHEFPRLGQMPPAAAIAAQSAACRDRQVVISARPERRLRKNLAGCGRD
jgi:hypothetical protein